MLNIGIKPLNFSFGLINTVGGGVSTINIHWSHFKEGSMYKAPFLLQILHFQWFFSCISMLDHEETCCSIHLPFKLPTSYPWTTGQSRDYWAILATCLNWSWWIPSTYYWLSWLLGLDIAINRVLPVLRVSAGECHQHITGSTGYWDWILQSTGYLWVLVNAINIIGS